MAVKSFKVHAPSLIFVAKTRAYPRDAPNQTPLSCMMDVPSLVCKFYIRATEKNTLAYYMCFEIQWQKFYYTGQRGRFHGLNTNAFLTKLFGGNSEKNCRLEGLFNKTFFISN
jgi:hypothetical protein